MKMNSKFKVGDMVSHRTKFYWDRGLVVFIDPDVQDLGDGPEHLLQVLWAWGKISIVFEHEIKKLMELYES